MRCNSYVYFGFYADFVFDTDEITQRLKIKPTSIKVKNNPIPKSTSWNYKLEAGNEINLELYVEELISIFEPQIEKIIELKNEYGINTILQFVIDIEINPNIPAPFFGLNKRIIKFLYKTNTEVDFDLYTTGE